MLMHGSNGVGYINYPNNVVHKFCKQASKYAVYIFCVFDYINYIKNLKLGVDANGRAGGFVEGTICYTRVSYVLTSYYYST